MKLIAINTKHKGINYSYSSKMIAVLGCSTSQQVKNSNTRGLDKNLMLVEQKKLYDKLKRSQVAQLNELVKNKVYKALRYEKGLPRRGQRTHTNAKTARKLKNAK